MMNEPTKSTFARNLSHACGVHLLSMCAVKNRDIAIDAVLVVSMRTPCGHGEMVLVRRDFAAKLMRENGDHKAAADVERATGDASRVTIVRTVNDELMVFDIDIATGQHLGMWLGLPIGNA